MALLGRADFLYVADSKLCSREAMGHIAAGGGRFVTVLPRSRGEDRWFRDWAQTHHPAGPRPGGPPGRGPMTPTRCTRPSPPRCPPRRATASLGASSAKAARDAASRQARIEAGAAAIDASPPAGRTQVPPQTRAAVEAEATACSTAPARAMGQLHPHRDRRGDLPPGTSRAARSEHPLPPPPRPASLAGTRLDGGLRRGHRRLLPADHQRHRADRRQVLTGYRYQPHLERRHHLLKSVQQAAPVRYAAPPASRRCSAASSSRCYSAPCSNARSAPRWPPHTPATSRSTPSCGPAPRPPPSASWRSSPTSPATTYTATVHTCRPSN